MELDFQLIIEQEYYKLLDDMDVKSFRGCNKHTDAVLTTIGLRLESMQS
jgi:hypothetical protein